LNVLSKSSSIQYLASGAAAAAWMRGSLKSMAGNERKANEQGRQRERKSLMQDADKDEVM